MNVKFFKHMVLYAFAFWSFGYNELLAQEKPKLKFDEVSLPVFVHGIKSKEDVEVFENLAKSIDGVVFVRVEDFPQQHTHLIIKKTLTPKVFNEIIMQKGFYVENQDFLDARDVEGSLSNAIKKTKRDEK